MTHSEAHGDRAHVRGPSKLTKNFECVSRPPAGLV
jgi:hypothetical protein